MCCTLYFSLLSVHSNRRTLRPYLDKYGLSAELIPRDSFLHPVHSGLADSTLKILVLDNDGHLHEEEVQANQFDNIHLIRICLKK